jgi:hypothetical protein
VTNQDSEKDGRSGNLTKVVLWLGAVLVILIVVAGALVWFTVTTHYSNKQVREWVFSVGTLVGGILSASAAVLVAAIGFGSQRGQARESEKQLRLQAEETRKAQAAATRSATKIRRVEERRRATSELVKVVADDLAWLNDTVLHSIQSMTHYDLSNAIEEFFPKLRRRHGKARSAIAMVPDAGLRSAADGVYTAWGVYLGALDNQVTNSIPMPPHAQAGVSAADVTFFESVDSHLKVLDKEEDELLGAMS